MVLTCFRYSMVRTKAPGTEVGVEEGRLEDWIGLCTMEVSVSVSCFFVVGT